MSPPTMTPFNLPHMTGKELYYIAQAHFNGMLAGDGPFTKRCSSWLQTQTHSSKALLTHSCTAALEMSALLLNIQPGDEIIMPSYTFVSTANAFVLRGGVPVFVDIRPDTFNLDEQLIEAAITPKTKAIVPVHYAGVGCEMDTILQIAKKHNLQVIEDAAQGMMATYKERPLGSMGSLGCLSFHETKNLISGEGGAILVNDSSLIQRAEIIREKGTDRSRFFRGEVDKYTWQEIGSSFLPGELIAAFLWAQFENAQSITQERLAIWERYHTLLKDLEEGGLLRRPIIPVHCRHNAHMYPVLFHSPALRDRVLQAFRAQHIHAVFHYIPLHSSPAGIKYGRPHGEMMVTNRVSNSLLRLPLWMGLKAEQQEQVVDCVRRALKSEVQDHD